MNAPAGDGSDHVPGMPDEIAEAVHRLNADSRLRALAVWSNLPEAKRMPYRDYADGPRWQRWQQWRCDRAARALAADSQEPPGELARWLLKTLGIVLSLADGDLPISLRDKLADNDEKTTRLI